MVAQLNEKSMELVVEGPQGRSLGLVMCCVQQTEMYDQKRQHFLWDFVLERDDATYVALHPMKGNTTVDCRFSLPVRDLELPRTGAGGTMGSWDLQVLHQEAGRLSIEV